MGMRFQSLIGLFLYLILMPFSAVCSADLPMINYEYRQDFEIADPFQYWTSSGSYTVNSKGLSKARASSGTKSFKLDVTLKKDTYLYFMIPQAVPNVGQLQLTGDLYVESTDGPMATLGTSVSFSPAPMSGVHKIALIGAPTPSWKTQSSDWVKDGTRVLNYLTKSNYATVTMNDVGVWANKIGLYIVAPKGGRIVLYVDNIMVKGVVPEEASYRSLVHDVWQNYLDRVQEQINTMADFVVNSSYEFSGSEVDPIIQSAKSQANNIKDSVRQKGYPTPDSYNSLRSLSQNMVFLSQNASLGEAHVDQVLFTFPFPPIMSVMNSPRILPETPPGFAALGDNMSIQACRGTYEPMSFILRAERKVVGIKISVSDLVGPDEKKIPASAVDIKLVKCWYQAGDADISKTEKRVLLPELLLNDDKLVKVDYVQQQNFLKVTIGGKEQYVGNSLPQDTIPAGAIIKDADVLQPFDLEAKSNKQVWVTVHVPVNAAAGVYHGTIRLQATGIPPADMNFTVTVLPFDLHPPSLEYAIYYRGKLSSTAPKGINSEWKTQEQYLAELNNIKNHGVLYPTLYQRNDQMFASALSLRNQLGFPKNHLYSLGITTENPTNTTKLKALGDEVAAMSSFISGYGVGKLYVYGIDEAAGEQLKSQRAAWQTVQDKGVGVFVAGHNLSGTVGDILDVAILSGPYDSGEVAAFHKNGKKVFSYGNPQAGVEDPEIYRRNYGLGLICAGYDGVMNYAYQHSFGHIWNDFDHDRFRDHVFAYPTSNGVIDTIQWEGFREAVDDVRYLTTLIAAKNGEKEQVMAWLCPLLSEKINMCELRSLIVKEILALEKKSLKRPSMRQIEPVKQ